MIRPLNIDSENHTADFVCSLHGGSVTGLNLNTNTSYDEDETVIIIQGSELTDSCGCITCFPVANGNADAQAIHQAKTS